MRITLPVLVLLLAACGGQSRYEYEDRDRWADYEPGQKYYDSSYVPPNRRTADALVDQAARAQQQGRPDQARVDYQQAFLRDRWHTEANTRYQDLMLDNDLQTLVWQEYLDLWIANPTRGDALWYHLRPMFLERIASAPPARGKPLADEDVLALAAVQAGVLEAANDAAALAQVRTALDKHDWIELHRMLIALWPEEELDALVDTYAERAEDDPSNGNNLALHALAIARADAHKAVEILRDGYVLGLPGYWLYYTFGEICADLGRITGADTRETRRQSAGWHRCAEGLYTYAARADRDDLSAELQGVRESLSELAKTGLDAQP
jgi:hypothetical protein